MVKRPVTQALARAVHALEIAARAVTREDLICVTGSFFIAAEIRELVRDQPLTRHEPPPAGSTA